MEKGEIARYEQFLLFPQCFQKACVPGASKGVIVWEWVMGLPNIAIFDQLQISIYSIHISYEGVGQQLGYSALQNKKKRKKS